MRTLFVFVLSVTFFATSFAQAGKDEALVALGSTSGLLVYNTYICIGAIADGYVGEVYSVGRVGELMDEQVASIEAVIGEYNKLSESGFITSDEDAAYISDLIVTLELLKKEAKALKDYAATGSTTASDDYNAARDAAWFNIEDLLGLW